MRTSVRACAVPEEFLYDPVTKTWGDPFARPEIRSATVEFIAPSEYMVYHSLFISLIGSYYF